MSNPDHCWTIVSVPEELEPLPWVLNNIASPIVKANKWENLPEGFKLLKLDCHPWRGLVSRYQPAPDWSWTR